MKKIFLIAAVSLNGFILAAQNVGIGTLTPTKKLSVSGSIVVDHDNTNPGTPDSAALLFGSVPGLTGILSHKNPASIRYGGLDFWTNSNNRMSINQNGNIGIGTISPDYKLHVVGSIYASINSYALNSMRIGDGTFSDVNKLQVNNGPSYFGGNGTFTGNLFTEGNITGNGFVYGQSIRAYEGMRADVRMAVGGATDENYRLRVYDGNTRLGGEFHATGNSAIGGLPDANYRLRVYDGNTRLGGEFHATGNSAIGGLPDANYKFRVYNGHSHFGGDVQVAGNIIAGSGSMAVNSISANSLEADNISATNSLTIGGKGSVRSNGPSSLRIGFSSKFIDDVLTSLDIHEYTVNIAEFEGDNDDVRVMVSQYINTFPGPPDSWNKVLITVSEVDPVTDTCKIFIRNTANAQISLKGTIYLTVIAKN